MRSKLTIMRQTIGQNIRRMSKDDALLWLARFRAEGVTAFHDSVRELTGGFSSQSICAYVVRRVAVKAGKCVAG